MQYSVVQKSELDEVVLRIDAEFYGSGNLKLQGRVRSLNNTHLTRARGKLDCSAFYPSIVPYYNFEKKGVPFLRVNEIQNALLHVTDETAFLPEQILQENRSTIASCFPGDIVIAKGGNTLGKVALITNDFPRYSVCRDLMVLGTHQLTGLNRFYLWMYLHSDIGQKLLLRTASQTGQPHLTVEAIYKMPIPVFSGSFQQRFETIFKRSESMRVTAAFLYADTEDELLSVLNIKGWKIKHRVSFTKSFSDVTVSDRIDAEYFQPMYDELVRRVKQYEYGCRTLGELTRVKDRIVLPREKVTYHYIELANISANGSVDGCIEASGKELPSRARRRVNTGDVIVSSIEGSLSSIALITEDLDNALCSTGFFVVNSQRINSETLLVLLKSLVGQLQLKKGGSGTILSAISGDEFKKLVLPDLHLKVQDHIKKKITEMYRARAISKRLLDIAKRGVEMAIEKNEKEAEKWMNKELQAIERGAH